MEDLKLLKERLQDVRILLSQIEAIKTRIEVSEYKDTKRLLSIAFTEIQTGELFLREAIEEQERVPSKRYG